jgi:hypothetical protein
MFQKMKQILSGCVLELSIKEQGQAMFPLKDFKNLYLFRVQKDATNRWVVVFFLQENKYSDESGWRLEHQQCSAARPV